MRRPWRGPPHQGRSITSSHKQRPGYAVLPQSAPQLHSLQLQLSQLQSLHDVPSQSQDSHVQLLPQQQPPALTAAGPPAMAPTPNRPNAKTAKPDFKNVARNIAILLEREGATKRLALS